MAACGGATNDTAGEKSGGHGGFTTDGGMGDGADVGAGGMTASGGGGAVGSGGRVSTGGRASGGASSGGRVSTGGTASGGASGAGGVGEARHPCMGSTDPNAGYPLCRTTNDCTGLAQCVLSVPSRTCRFLPTSCMSDMECAAGTVCQLVDCNYRLCSTPCTTSCPAGATCTNQHCVPTPCDSPGGACPEGSICKPNDPSADEHGCFVPHCGKASDCKPNYDCVASAAGSGCVQHPCKVDGDCACGYCVNALCEPTLGFCYEMIAMPYGCVWPDEELV